MFQKEKVVLSWSGGKDSALALYALQQGNEYEIDSLLTTIGEAHDRISHHGVRAELLERQAEALHLPLRKVYLPATSEEHCTNAEYEAVMEKAMRACRKDGITKVAYGDILLEDLRAYREDNLAEVGMQGVFPLWGRDTDQLADEFTEFGFQAYLTCVDGERLKEEFAGRPFDEDLLRDLPEGVDPCGENGEFHSFVWDGPVFRHPVRVHVAQTVRRGDRYFTELLPDEVKEPLEKTDPAQL